MKKMHNKDRQLQQTLSMLFRVSDGNATPDDLVKYTQFQEANKLAEHAAETTFFSEQDTATSPTGKSWPDLEQRISQWEESQRAIPWMGRHWRPMAAAVLFICLSGLVYFMLNKDRMPSGGNTAYRAGAAIPPASARATLLLGNNKPIYLQDEVKGTVASQGNIDIVAGKGSLLYRKGMHGPSAELMMNTLSTPSSSFFTVMLADGTKMMLNAESQVIYPASFDGGIREVTLLKGEAYFEVTHNGKPFVVKYQDKSIQVLGTRFNVNAYDETGVKTTLLEGKVQLESNSQKQVMAPGEQAITYTHNDVIQLFRQEDADASISWTKGVFSFTDMEIKNIMKEMGRWYDVEVVCTPSIQSKKLTMSILSRGLSLDEALYALSDDGAHFRYAIKASGDRPIVLVTPH